MVAEIDKARQQSNLSSAIRLFVLDHLRGRVATFTPSQDGAMANQSSMVRNGMLSHA
jgi:predicted DNA-binding ribbon-helix-helix protein